MPSAVTTIACGLPLSPKSPNTAASGGAACVSFRGVPLVQGWSGRPRLVNVSNWPSASRTTASGLASPLMSISDSATTAGVRHVEAGVGPLNR